MQTHIIVGSQQARDTYINQFITDHSIASYNITCLNEPIKIADVHTVLRAMRMQVGKTEKRLLVFSGMLTVPAQNALLKFLEEISESDTVFFDVESKDYLLDTIISRCQIISLSQAQEPVVDSTYFDSFFTQSVVTRSEFLKMAQTVLSNRDYEDYIFSLREWIRRNINGNANQLFYAVKLLGYLHRQYQLVKENNVNPKFTIESAGFRI